VELATVGSVVSFFLGPVDTAVDASLDELGAGAVKELCGEAALANARLAYRLYEERLGSERWRALAAAGARPQRLLWTATQVGNPAHRDTRYVEGLVVWGTVSAMTEATQEALADHGELRGDTVTGEHTAARGVMDALERLGISFAKVSRELEEQALRASFAAWERLSGAVEDALRRPHGAPDRVTRPEPGPPLT
jgi:transaldolase